MYEYVVNKNWIIKQVISWKNMSRIKYFKKLYHKLL